MGDAGGPGIDQVDHGNGVKVDAPKCHEAKDTDLDGDN